jgi:hypothetical protein
LKDHDYDSLSPLNEDIDHAKDRIEKYAKKPSKLKRA